MWINVPLVRLHLTQGKEVQRIAQQLTEQGIEVDYIDSPSSDQLKKNRFCSHF